MVFAVVFGFGEGMSCMALGVLSLMSVTRRQRSFALGGYLTACAIPMAATPPFIGKSIS
jgi:hypothetical protein